MGNRKSLGWIIGILGLWVVVVIGIAAFVAKRPPRLARPAAAPGSTASLPQPYRPARDDSFAGKPLPCGPKAFTEKQYAQLALSYYGKRGLLAYRQFGQHSPAWDPVVTEFLEKTGRRQAGVDPVPTKAEIAGLTERVLASGCPDPLVQSLLGQQLSGQDKATAEACLQRALKGFAGGRYPVYCQLGVTFAMAGLKEQLGPKATGPSLEWRDRAVKIVAAAAQAKFFGPREQRVYWGKILGKCLQKELQPVRGEVLKALEAQPGVDPWLLLMARGQVGYQEAWDARGQGWARDVPREAWPKFERGVSVARENWEQAYALHPEFPEAAIALCSAACSSGGANPRVWFDRAVAAQFDEMTAYESLMAALQPRWGGSHGAMLSFADECLATGRFDTRVPMMYDAILKTIGETDGEPGIWQNAEVWQKLETAYEGRAAYFRQNNPELERPLRTYLIGRAWETGHLDTLRRQLEAVGGQPDMKTYCTVTRDSLELVTAGAYASSSAQRAALKDAERQYQGLQGHQATANRAAQKVFGKLLRREQEPHVRHYLGDRLQGLRWEQEFGGKRWVDLRPTEDLVGWEVAAGKATPTADGQGFQLTPDDRGALLLCHIRPGMAYELTCDVEFPVAVAKSLQAGFLAEFVTRPETSFDICNLQRDPPQGRCGLWNTKLQAFPLGTVPPQAKLTMLKNTDRYTLRLNDQVVFENQRVGENGTVGGAIVGLGGEGWPDRSQAVSYRNVKIRWVEWTR